MTKDATQELDLGEESDVWRGVPVTIEGEKRVGIRIRQPEVAVPLSAIARFDSKYSDLYLVKASGSIYHFSFDPLTSQLHAERASSASGYGFRPIVAYSQEATERQVKGSPASDFVVGKPHIGTGGYETGSEIVEIVLVGKKIYQAADMPNLERKCLDEKSDVSARFKQEVGAYPPMLMAYKEWQEFYKKAWGRCSNPSERGKLSQLVLSRHP